MSPVARQWVPLIALLLLSVVGTAIASPQPENVCGACSDAFEDVASEQGVPVNVTHSTATVSLHENGSATWVVTNRVNGSAADRFAESPAVLHRVARAAATEGYGLPDGRKVSSDSVAASVDGRTITLRFRERDASERRLGLAVARTLHRDGVMGGWLLNADRFTVVGPPGTVLVNEPNDGLDGDEPAAVPDVDGRRVTWTGPATDWGSFINHDVYLVYGPPETTEQHVDAAVALATAPIWIENVKLFVLPPTAVYGVLLLGVAAVAHRAGPGERRRLGRGIAVLGLLGIVAAAIAQRQHQPAWFGGLGAVYLVTGVVARRRPALLSTIRGAVAVAAGAAVAAGLASLAIEPIWYLNAGLPLSVVEQAAYHLPVAVGPAFGLAVAPGTTRRVRRIFGAFAGALVVFLAAGALLVPVASRPFGIIVVVTGGGALLSALLAVPLAVLAVGVSQRGREGPVES